MVFKQVCQPHLRLTDDSQKSAPNTAHPEWSTCHSLSPGCSPQHIGSPSRGCTHSFFPNWKTHLPAIGAKSPVTVLRCTVVASTKAPTGTMSGRTSVAFDPMSTWAVHNVPHTVTDDCARAVEVWARVLAPSVAPGYFPTEW